MSQKIDALPDYDRVVFTKSPLVLTLVQIRFPSVPEFPDENVQKELRVALRSTFPEFTAERMTNLVVTPQGVSPVQGNETWRFRSLDRAWSIVIAGDSVALETYRYASFEEFVAQAVQTIGIVGQSLKVDYQTRVGLRYVNELRHPKGDDYETWRKLLNPDLLGLGRSNLLGGTVEQTIGEVLSARRDGKLLVRHGFLRGSTVAPTPGKMPPQTGFYLLDLDYFNEDPTKFGQALDTRLKTYHDVVYRIFRWAVQGGALFRYLGGSL